MTEAGLRVHLVIAALWLLPWSAQATTATFTGIEGLYLYHDTLWIHDSDGWRKLTFSPSLNNTLTETPEGGRAQTASEATRITLFRYYCTHPERTLNGGVPERAGFLFSELEAAEKRWPGSALVEYCRKSVQNFFGARQPALAQLVPTQAEKWTTRWVAPTPAVAPARPLAQSPSPVATRSPKATPLPVAPSTQSVAAGIVAAQPKGPKPPAHENPVVEPKSVDPANSVASKPAVAAKPAGCQPEGSYEVVPESNATLAVQRGATPRMLGWGFANDEKGNWVGCFVPIRLKRFKPDPEFPHSEVEAIDDYYLEGSVKSHLWDFYCKQPQFLLSSPNAAEFVLANWHTTQEYRKCVEPLPALLRDKIDSHKITPELAKALESRIRQANSEKTRWVGLALGAAKFPPPARERLHSATRVKSDLPLAHAKGEGFALQSKPEDLFRISYDYAKDYLGAEDGTNLNSPESRQSMAEALCQSAQTAFTNRNQLEFLVRYISKNPGGASDECAERLASLYLTLTHYSLDRTLEPWEAAAELGWARGRAGEIIDATLAKVGRRLIPQKDKNGKVSYSMVTSTTKDQIVLHDNDLLMYLDSQGYGHAITTEILSPQNGSAWAKFPVEERKRVAADALDALAKIPEKSRRYFMTSMANELVRTLAHGALDQKRPEEAAQWVARLAHANPTSRSAVHIADGLRDRFPNPDDWEKVLNEALTPALPRDEAFSEYACKSVCNLFASYAGEWASANPKTRWVTNDPSDKAPMEFAILSLQALFLVRAAPYCQGLPGVDATKTLDMVNNFWKKASEIPGNLSGYLGAYSTHFSILMAQQNGDRAKEKELREKLRELLAKPELSVTLRNGNGSRLQTYGLSSTSLSLDLQDIPDSQTLGADSTNPISRMETALEKFLKAQKPDFDFSKVAEKPQWMELALGTPYNLTYNFQSRVNKGEAAARNVTLYMALYRSNPEKYKPMILPVLQNYLRYRGSLVLDYGVTNPGESEHSGRYNHASYYWGPACPYAVDWLHDVLRNETWTKEERDSLVAIDRELQGALKSATQRAALFTPEGRERLGAHGSWEIPLAGTSLIGFIDRCNGAKGDGTSLFKEWKTKRRDNSMAHAGSSASEPLHQRAEIQ